MSKQTITHLKYHTVLLRASTSYMLICQRKRQRVRSRGEQSEAQREGGRETYRQRWVCMVGRVGGLGGQVQAES